MATPHKLPSDDQLFNADPNTLHPHLRLRRAMRMQRINVHHLSQSKLAKRINVDHSTVTRWELGERTPTRENLVAMAEAFGVPVFDFLTEVGRQDLAGPEHTDHLITMARAVRAGLLEQLESVETMLRMLGAPVKKEPTVQEAITDLRDQVDMVVTYFNSDHTVDLYAHKGIRSGNPVEVARVRKVATVDQGFAGIAARLTP